MHKVYFHTFSREPTTIFFCNTTLLYQWLSLDRNCLYNLFVFVQHVFLEHGVRDKPLSTDSARMGHQFDHPVRLGFVLTNTVVLKKNKSRCFKYVVYVRWLFRHSNTVAYLGESLSTNVAGEHFVGLVMYSFDVVF